MYLFDLRSWYSSSSSPGLLELAWRFYPWHLNASRRNTHFGVHLQLHQALPYFLVDSHQHRLLIHFPLFYFEDTTNIMPKIMTIVSFYLWEILFFLSLSWSWSYTCIFLLKVSSSLYFSWMWCKTLSFLIMGFLQVFLRKYSSFLLDTIIPYPIKFWKLISSTKTSNKLLPRRGKSIKSYHKKLWIINGISNGFKSIS